MRELKFRAWDNENKAILLPVGVGSSQECLNKRNEFIDRCTLMQYTGLHDKNGKEIYEGDIVKGLRQNYRYRKPTDIQELIFEVWFDEADCAFKLWYPKMQWDSFMTMDRPYEVIGNVWENPELLT